jgi:hypothetical protein
MMIFYLHSKGKKKMLGLEIYNSDALRDGGAAMSREVTLGDFVRLLAVKIPQNGRTMPFQDESPWHTLFYRLKKELPDPKPRFISDLVFDWDGPSPKSQDISDFLQALHWTGSVAALNPSYEQIIVLPAIGAQWTEELADLGPDVCDALNLGITLAKEEFPALAAD